MSLLVEHARRELELSGQTAEDPNFSESLIKAVEGFASYGGHSGGSASIAIQMLHRLLQFKSLSPLTNHPDEWMYISDERDGGPIHQNRRQSSAFSNDRGKTYYDVDEWMESGYAEKKLYPTKDVTSERDETNAG